MATAAENIYEQYIKGLSGADQLHLVSLIARQLAASQAGSPQRSLLELEGLGADIWQGIDAQAYVDEIRKEWDGRHDGSRRSTEGRNRPGIRCP